MIKELFEKALVEVEFEKLVRQEIEKTHGPQPHGIGMEVILATVLPIVIKVLIEYVIPYMIKTGIPWLKDKLGKKELMEMFTKSDFLDSLVSKILLK